VPHLMLEMDRGQTMKAIDSAPTFDRGCDAGCSRAQLLEALLALAQGVMRRSAPGPLASTAWGTIQALTAILEAAADSALGNVPPMPLEAYETALHPPPARSLIAHTPLEQAELVGFFDALSFVAGAPGPFWWSPLNEEIERRRRLRSQASPADS
jgi:hypothetical protein